MAGAAQVQDKPLSSQYRVKKARPYRLKCRWSYGRGYVVTAGIALAVLASLAVVHLHQTWQQIWQRWQTSRLGAASHGDAEQASSVVNDCSIFH